MSITVDKLNSMRTAFYPCRCGSPTKDHDHVRVYPARTGRVCVNRSSHAWWGTDGLGMWWMTIGTTRARYYDTPEQALAAAARIVGDDPTISTWVHPKYAAEATP